MPALAATYGNHVKETASIYLATFARAYAKFGLPQSNFSRAWADYENTIKGNMPEIMDVATTRINAYLKMYDIRVNAFTDEFKLIYYVGRAIEWQLDHYGQVALIPVHLFAMIGLLDHRLRKLGLRKPTLVRALTKLVRLSRLYDEMGPTGVYLIYKTLSTAITDISKIEKGAGSPAVTRVQ